MKLSYLDLMTTDPSYNLAMEQYCAWLRRFSKCFGAECIDFRADFFDPNGRLKRELLLDGLHPTPEGHQIMARRLCAHLKRERQG